MLAAGLRSVHRRSGKTFPFTLSPTTALVLGINGALRLSTAVVSKWCRPQEIYHILDNHPHTGCGACESLPQGPRRKGLFAGKAAFGRSVSKTEWVYGFKVALSVSPEGVVTAFGLAPANCDERPIGEFLVSSDGHDTFLADEWFLSVERERRFADWGKGKPAVNGGSRKAIGGLLTKPAGRLSRPLVRWFRAVNENRTPLFARRCLDTGCIQRLS